MIIRNFENSDIKNAFELSHLVWGDFYKKENTKVQNLIYDFTLRYYDLNRNFSYSVLDENKNLKGFLLAFKKENANDSLIIINSITQTLNNKNEQTILYEFYEFLQCCGYETKKLMDNNDIMLGLFVSIQKGCGKLLLSKLIQDCQKQKLKTLYLWSDTTCDYTYYQKNNFELVKKTKTTLNNQEITFFIYRKNINDILNIRGLYTTLH